MDKPKLKTMGKRWEVNLWLSFFLAISGIGSGYGMFLVLESFIQFIYLTLPIGMAIGIGTLRVAAFRVYELAGQPQRSSGLFKDYIQEFFDPIILTSAILGMFGNAAMFYSGIKLIDSQKIAAYNIAKFNESQYQVELERQQEKLANIRADQVDLRERGIISKGYNVNAARQDSLETVYQARLDSLARQAIQSYASVGSKIDNFAIMGVLSSNIDAWMELEGADLSELSMRHIQYYLDRFGVSYGENEDRTVLIEKLKISSSTAKRKRNFLIVVFLAILVFLFDGSQRICIRKRRLLDNQHNSQNGLTPLSPKNSTKTVNVNAESLVNRPVNSTVNSSVNGYVNRDKETILKEIIQRIRKNDPEILLIHQLLVDPAYPSQKAVAKAARKTPAWISYVKQAYERLGTHV